MSSKIITHTLHFIKLYFIHLYDTNQPFPTLDKEFIMVVMKTVCEKPKRTKGDHPVKKTVTLSEPLMTFFVHIIKPLQLDQPNYICMNQILQYLAVDILNYF